MVVSELAGMIMRSEDPDLMVRYTAGGHVYHCLGLYRDTTSAEVIYLITTSPRTEFL